MKTAQETKAEVLAATSEMTEAIRDFLKGLGFEKIYIEAYFNSIDVVSETPEYSRKRNCLNITADYNC